MDESRWSSITDGDPITQSEFALLQAELSSFEEEPWRTIPWQVSLIDAFTIARSEKKDVMLVVRSGHPLGCTCNNGLVDRAMVDHDPEVASLLRTRFIPVAIDQHIHRRLDDEEGRAFTALVKQAGPIVELTAQGFYVFTSSAKLKSFRHTQDGNALKRFLLDALAQPGSDSRFSAPLPFEHVEHSVLHPPKDVVVLDVVSKVLGGYHEPATERERTLQASRGRDHCWIRPDEVEDIALGVMPRSLLTRMARYHLVDNTRGEPPMWRADHVRSLTGVLLDGNFSGSARIETGGSRRGYSAQLSGRIRAEGKMLKEFDVIARGPAWGRGYHNKGAPHGKYPFAVRFSIVNGVWPFDAIPPGAARTRSAEYLGYSVAVGL